MKQLHAQEDVDSSSPKKRGAATAKVSPPCVGEGEHTAEGSNADAAARPDKVIKHDAELSAAKACLSVSDSQTGVRGISTDFFIQVLGSLVTHLTNSMPAGELFEDPDRAVRQDQAITLKLIARLGQVNVACRNAIFARPLHRNVRYQFSFDGHLEQLLSVQAQLQQALSAKYPACIARAGLPANVYPGSEPDAGGEIYILNQMQVRRHLAEDIEPEIVALQRELLLASQEPEVSKDASDDAQVLAAMNVILLGVDDLGSVTAKNLRNQLRVQFGDGIHSRKNFIKVELNKIWAAHLAVTDDDKGTLSLSSDDEGALFGEHDHEDSAPRVAAARKAPDTCIKPAEIPAEQRVLSLLAVSAGTCGLIERPVPPM